MNKQNNDDLLITFCLAANVKHNVYKTAYKSNAVFISVQLLFNSSLLSRVKLCS